MDFVGQNRIWTPPPNGRLPYPSSSKPTLRRLQRAVLLSSDEAELVDPNQTKSSWVFSHSKSCELFPGRTSSGWLLWQGASADAVLFFSLEATPPFLGVVLGPPRPEEKTTNTLAFGCFFAGYPLFRVVLKGRHKNV